jgi:uncharacterized protein (TIGR03437 family)
VQTGGFSGPVIFSVQDAESSRKTVVPGEWVAIYGANLSNTNRAWGPGDFTSGGSLPTTLDSVGVQFNGVSAPVYYISADQVNVQVPDGVSGQAPVAVTTNGSQSLPFTATVVSAAPSVFEYDAANVAYAVATHADGSLIGDPLVMPNSSPAMPGETIVLYVNGFDTSPSGIIVSSAVPSTDPVTVVIGGLTANVTFHGLVEAGVFQINVVIPKALAEGSYTVFSDLSFSNTGAGACVTGSATGSCGPMTNRWIASPFTPSGNFILTQVDLALGWSSGTNGAIIDLVNDQNGVPGTSILESWNISSLPSTGPNALTTLTSNGTVLLTQGTPYWLVAKGAASDTLDFWDGNNLGFTGAASSLDQGASWTSGASNLSAFDVLGARISGQSAAVPVVVTAGGVSSQPNLVLIIGGSNQ